MHLRYRVHAVIASLGGAHPSAEEFMKRNAPVITQLCQEGWLLRFLEVTCREHVPGNSIVDTIRFHMI